MHGQLDILSSEAAQSRVSRTACLYIALLAANVRICRVAVVVSVTPPIMGYKRGG